MSELKVGDVLYPRYRGLIIRDGGDPRFYFYEQRVTVIRINSEYDNLWTSDLGHYSLKPDARGLSWKTFYTKE